MKTKSTESILGCLLALFTLACWPAVMAANSPEDQKTINELKATYPLDTCVVTGNKLDGDMGKPVDYLYKSKVDGKETVRLVRFCCGSCPKTFLKDPEKYLKMIDDASKNKKVSSNETTPTSGCAMGHCKMD